MKGIGGDIPQMVRNPEGAGIKRLFFSQRDIALIKDKTCQAGYGVLKAGTVVACNASSGSANLGKLVPYVPVYDTPVTFGTDSAIGAARMVADGSSGHVYVSLEDSYKFAVGDEIVFENASGEGPVDCGHISAIDRTTSTIWADITTEAYTATNATVAKTAYVYVKSATSDPWSTAKFILDKDVNTGVGEEAQGALASVVISNAIVYTNSLVNMTAAAISALSAVQDGQHTIIK